MRASQSSSLRRRSCSPSSHAIKLPPHSHLHNQAPSKSLRIKHSSRFNSTLTLTHPFNSPIHSLIHLPTLTITHSLKPLTHSTHSLTHSKSVSQQVQFLIWAYCTRHSHHSLAHSFMYLVTHTHDHSRSHSCTHSLSDTCTLSLIQLFSHTRTHIPHASGRTDKPENSTMPIAGTLIACKMPTIHAFSSPQP